MMDKKERDYQELNRLGRILGVPVFEAFLELEVRLGGKVIHYHKQRSHSWCRNAYNWMFTALATKDADDPTDWEGGKLNAKDTSGNVRSDNDPFGAGTSTFDGTSYGFRAPAGDDGHGIQIGTGTNAESFEDYMLQTQIADGTAAGEMSHVESEAHSVSYVGGTKVLSNEFVRYFNNNSGGEISVAEVALVAHLSEPVIGHYLMARDKLGSAVAVPDTGQLKVTYTISLTYAG